jgi:hypothetical protein
VSQHGRQLAERLGEGGDGLLAAVVVVLVNDQHPLGDGEHQVPAGVLTIVGEPLLDLLVGTAG